MAIARRLAPLTRDSLDEIPAPCRTCTRWELDAVHRSRVEADGGGGDAKAAWLSSTLLDWGSCGQVVRLDGEVAGYALYAPPAYLPGLAAYPTAPVSPDAVALAALRVEPEHADHGLARMLVQGMAADLARRGVRAVEAIASATPGAVDCLVPADFLLAVGFTTVRPHPRTPRLRLDLRSTAAWREDVVEAALERLLGRRRAVGTLHREDPTG
ncbi:MAG TPA: GNAT family N-acetyltransferase [Candidatus Nanopelagicales bacterium]